MMKKFVLLLMAVLLCSVAFAEDTEPVYHHGGTWSSWGYSIDVYWEEGIEQDEELLKVIQQVFFDKYPAIRETFGTCEERNFTLYLVNAMDEGLISRRSAEGVYMSYKDLKDSEKHMNHLISQFAVKVMKNHPNPEGDAVIDVLSDGLIAYTENVYAVNPDEAIWLIPYAEGQQLTDGYQIAGAFLKWIADTYGDDIPVRLNRALCEGYYNSHDFWLCAAGNTLENLWEQYAQQSLAQ